MSPRNPVLRKKSWLLIPVAIVLFLLGLAASYGWMQLHPGNQEIKNLSTDIAGGSSYLSVFSLPMDGHLNVEVFVENGNAMDVSLKKVEGEELSGFGENETRSYRHDGILPAGKYVLTLRDRNPVQPRSHVKISIYLAP